MHTKPEGEWRCANCRGKFSLYIFEIMAYGLSIFILGVVLGGSLF
jgi:hypothetical protein